MANLKISHCFWKKLKNCTKRFKFTSSGFVWGHRHTHRADSAQLDSIHRKILYSRTRTHTHTHTYIYIYIYSCQFQSFLSSSFSFAWGCIQCLPTQVIASIQNQKKVPQNKSVEWIHLIFCLSVCLSVCLGLCTINQSTVSRPAEWISWTDSVHTTYDAMILCTETNFGFQTKTQL